MHFYMDCLIHGREIGREISFDDVAVINTVRLTPNAGGAIDLPCDFQDVCKLGYQSGQMIVPLVQSNNLNRLINYSSSGEVIPYSNNRTDGLGNPTNLYYTYPVSYFWGITTVNDWGEFTGRLYGWGDDSQDTYMIIPERNQIQLNESLCVDFVVLEYINNGMGCDAATRIDAYAMKTITAYIMWQLKEQNRNYNTGEREIARQEYLRQRQILRARLDPITPDVIRRIIHKNYVQAPKYY